MESQNSYYPYSENFLFRQTSSSSINYFTPAQPISNEPYFLDIPNHQSGQISKEDRKSSFTNSGEYSNRPNNQQTEEIIKDDMRNSYPTSNQCVYWNNSSFRSNNLPNPKLEEYDLISRGTFVLKTPYDGDKSKNYNRKLYNHYNSNFDYTTGAERKIGQKSFLLETPFNKYNSMFKSGRCETHNGCVFGSSYVNTNSCLADGTINTKDLKERINNSNYSEYCDDYYSGLTNYYGLPVTSNISELDNTDQQTEDSNEESDIIVEESEEENCTIQINEHMCNRCVVCNLIFAPQGVQFYYVTSNSPVTMTSQRPVLFLLKSLIRNIRLNDTYICCECLVLLNTIDHFQSQLDNYKNEFKNKLRKTNSLNLKSENFRLKHSRKFKQAKIMSTYQCKYCKKMLYFKNYCYYHIIKHKHSNILCEKCGILCKSSKMFYKHACLSTEISKPSVMQAVTCSNCNKVFRTKFQLKEHQNSCLSILPYICKVQNCGKKFATNTRLKNHGKLKHEKKFIAICSICNIGFIKISDYKSHKVIHSNDKKFHCRKCGRSYKTISNLNFHIKSHQQSLPYSCNICLKGFMRKEYLETHINNHKGIKNFVCNICSKKFASQKNLDSHFKYHDGSIQKQVCNICGKSLTTSMNEHLRIHTNLREYECNQCDLKFNTKGTLRKHQKSKHKAM